MKKFLFSFVLVTIVGISAQVTAQEGQSQYQSQTNSDGTVTSQRQVQNEKASVQAEATGDNQAEADYRVSETMNNAYQKASENQDSRAAVQTKNSSGTARVVQE
ncbi:MAG: hypothetical protein PVF73_05340 [Bacteroidales bacterium]|jgi:hypothetical protein